jgi:hypothetical protein
MSDQQRTKYFRVGRRLTEHLKSQFTSLTESQDATTSELLCSLVGQTISESEIQSFTAPPEGETDGQTKARFLLAIERIFHVSRAMKLTEICPATVKGWIQSDREFLEDFRDAQKVFIEDQEANLLKCGRGDLTGGIEAFRALQTFLNTHHPQHGCAERQLIAQTIAPAIEQFTGVANEMVTDAVTLGITT